MTDEATDAQVGYVSYAEFGRRFFEIAVTRERVLGAVGDLAGRPIEFGPTGVGPIGLVKVSANGSVGEPTVQPRSGADVAFDLGLPIELQLLIEIGIEKYRFTAQLLVRLVATARAAEPLKVVIDVEAPTRRNIDVDLQADGLRASVVQAIGGVEGELKRTVVKVVSKEIERGREARTIDVEQALAKLGGPKTKPTPD